MWADGALSRLEAAKFLGIRETKFRSVRAENDIPTRYIGDKPVFAKAWLVAFLEGAPTCPPKD